MIISKRHGIIILIVFLVLFFSRYSMCLVCNNWPGSYGNEQIRENYTALDI